ncbi:MAG: peptidylprolyl isomerase [Myxococcota bacterium]|nr:peptidylprolyl isomerase [Myxococcota bacterium]
MLRSMRQGSRWIMWIVIIGVGAVFVFYLGGGAAITPSAGADSVVRVGERTYDARDLYRVRQQQEAEYRRILGDGFDAEAASDALDRNAAAVLTRTALLALEGERLGLHVTDDEVRAYLRQIAGVAEGERIDEENVTRFAERQYGSLARFEEALRDSLLAEKARRLLYSGVAISEAEILDSLRFAREEVKLVLAKLRFDQVDEAQPVDEADLSAVLGEQAEEIRQEYERRLSEFDQPEQVRARHILFRVDETANEADEAGVLERVKAAQTRLDEGADFADLALELSDDPGSQARGGDLGFFARGAMVKPFEDVAFSAEPGVVSEPVRSAFGFHLIRVEEKKAAQVIPYETARDQIAEERARKETARREARQRAESLSALVAEGIPLVDAARDEGLTLERPDPMLRRADGYVPGLGSAPGVMAAAFQLDPGASDATIHEAADAFVLISVVERTTPSDEELSEALETQRENLTNQRRNQTEGAWITALEAELLEKGELAQNLDLLR